MATGEVGPAGPAAHRLASGDLEQGLLERPSKIQGPTCNGPPEGAMVAKCKFPTSRGLQRAARIRANASIYSTILICLGLLLMVGVIVYESNQWRGHMKAESELWRSMMRDVAKENAVNLHFNGWWKKGDDHPADPNFTPLQPGHRVL